MIRSSLDIFLISANFAAVKSMNDGSFFFPLLGTGAKKGLSVSIKILSIGIDLNVSCKSQEILKVMMPLAEKNEFKVIIMTLNSFFSASGIITFKISWDLQDTFKSIPMDNILIETDSPFLAPVPKRGKKNEPSFIDFTAAKLAEIKNISKEDLIKKTTDNFNKLFFN